MASCNLDPLWAESQDIKTNNQPPPGRTSGQMGQLTLIKKDKPNEFYQPSGEQLESPIDRQLLPFEVTTQDVRLNRALVAAELGTWQNISTTTQAQILSANQTTATDVEVASNFLQALKEKNVSAERISQALQLMRSHFQISWFDLLERALSVENHYARVLIILAIYKIEPSLLTTQEWSELATEEWAIYKEKTSSIYFQESVRILDSQAVTDDEITANINLRYGLISALLELSPEATQKREISEHLKNNWPQTEWHQVSIRLQHLFALLTNPANKDIQTTKNRIELCSKYFYRVLEAISNIQPDAETARVIHRQVAQHYHDHNLTHHHLESAFFTEVGRRTAKFMQNLVIRDLREYEMLFRIVEHTKNYAELHTFINGIRLGLIALSPNTKETKNYKIISKFLKTLISTYISRMTLRDREPRPFTPDTNLDINTIDTLIELLQESEDQAPIKDSISRQLFGILDETIRASPYNPIVSENDLNVLTTLHDRASKYEDTEVSDPFRIFISGYTSLKILKSMYESKHNSTTLHDRFFDHLFSAVKSHFRTDRWSEVMTFWNELTDFNNPIHLTSSQAEQLHKIYTWISSLANETQRAQLRLRIIKYYQAVISIVLKNPNLQSGLGATESLEYLRQLMPASDFRAYTIQEGDWYHKYIVERRDARSRGVYDPDLDIYEDLNQMKNYEIEQTIVYERIYRYRNIFRSTPKDQVSEHTNCASFLTDQVIFRHKK